MKIIFNRRAFIQFASLLMMGTILSGCLPSETPATPGTSTSSSDGSGGSGSGDGGSGSGGGGSTTVTYPADPAIGGPYKYVTISTDGMTAEWTVYTPTKADGTEDTDQVTMVHGIVRGFSRRRVASITQDEIPVVLNRITTISAECGAKNSTTGLRVCNATQLPTTIGTTTLGTSCSTTKNAVIAGYTIEAEGPTDYCPSSANQLSTLTKMNKAPSFYFTDGNHRSEFEILELPGISLQVNWGGVAQSGSWMNSKVAITNLAQVVHNGFSVEAANCTDFVPGFYPLLQMNKFEVGGAEGYGVAGSSSAIQSLAINSAGNIYSGFLQVLCESVRGSEYGFYDCGQGGNFRNNIVSLTGSGTYDFLSTWAGAATLSDVACNGGVRNIVSDKGFLLLTKWGGAIMYYPNIIGYIGIKSAGPIGSTNLIGKSLIGNSMVNYRDSKTVYNDIGRLIKIDFSTSTTTSTGYKVYVSSDSGSFGGGTSKLQILPFSSVEDHAYYDNYNSSGFTAITSDTISGSYYSSVGSMQTTMGLYQIYEDSYAPSLFPPRQGWGYIGRLGKHLTALFSFHDTYGGTPNPLNTTGVAANTNPLNAMGDIPQLQESELWDTGGTLDATGVYLTVSSMMSAAITGGSSNIRILQGASGANPGLYHVVSKAGLVLTLDRSAGTTDAGVAYILADGVVSGAGFDRIKTSCMFYDNYNLPPNWMNEFYNITLAYWDGANFQNATYKVADRLDNCTLQLGALVSGTALTTTLNSVTYFNSGRVRPWTMMADSDGYFVSTSGRTLANIDSTTLEQAQNTEAETYDGVKVGSLVEVSSINAGVLTAHGVFLVNKVTSWWGGTANGRIHLSRNGVNQAIDASGLKQIQIKALGGRTFDAREDNSSYGFQTTGFMMLLEK